jgi:site-specific DNA-methyltransferase (adenine-specific)
MTSICLNGDCLELMKDLSNNSIDLFICDLPYGCITSKTCKWDIKIDLEKFWIEIKRLSRNDKTAVLMFCDAKFGVDLIMSNPSWFRYDLIWNKNNGTSFLLANKMPMKSHEMIYVFCKKSCNYNRIDQFVEGKKAYINYHGGDYIGKVFNNTKANLERKNEENMRCPLSVININAKKKEKHPTAKPVELYDWLIKRYSNEGDTILDPTAGSFNSGRSALGLKRNYIGMEMNDEFYDKNKIAS